jgi:hypothetical protein
MPACRHACRQHGSTADMVKGNCAAERNPIACAQSQKTQMKCLLLEMDPIGGSVSSLRELDLLGHPAGYGAALRARTSETAGRRRGRQTAVGR